VERPGLEEASLLRIQQSTCLAGQATTLLGQLRGIKDAAATTMRLITGRLRMGWLDRMHSAYEGGCLCGMVVRCLKRTDEGDVVEGIEGLQTVLVCNESYKRMVRVLWFSVVACSSSWRLPQRLICG
jgi:hypothetical protein